MAKRTRAPNVTTGEPWAISEIQVAGFKSISDEQRIAIRPLTILAGANSSGKSSIMQPLLLLKQTLEARYDAGPLLLHGPNVKFTSAEQLLSRLGRGRSLNNFHIGIQLTSEDSFKTTYRKEHKTGFQIEQMDVTQAGRTITLRTGMTQAEIIKTGITKGMEFAEEAPKGYSQGQWKIRQDRCFLEPRWVAKHPDGTIFSAGGRPGVYWEKIILEVIHLPGLRGNPERTYPVAAVGPTYRGTFENYTAGLISDWMAERHDILGDLNADLKLLALTGGVTADRINGVQIELSVGRLPNVPPTRPEDRVNIADVGVGVSQTLPVLVALHAAKPGQLVYVEQPETHLHPRAQFALAQVLGAAAKRGVRVVVETHSSILLLGVQALVAEGSLAPDKIMLHWFQREKGGSTVVRRGELDKAGAFGDWPEDFDDVELTSQKRYLDAAQERLSRAKYG